MLVLKSPKLYCNSHILNLIKLPAFVKTSISPSGKTRGSWTILNYLKFGLSINVIINHNEPNVCRQIIINNGNLPSIHGPNTLELIISHYISVN